jgi:hypothetical protein
MWRFLKQKHNQLLGLKGGDSELPLQTEAYIKL